MGRKKKVVKYQEYFSKHSADDLFKRYRDSVQKGSLTDIPAREEATKILNTVRMYEAYVQRIEKQYKRELNRTKRELRRALERIKLLEKQALQPKPGYYKINPLAVVKSADGGSLAAGKPIRPINIKINKLMNLAQKIDTRFNKHIAEKIADNRGDDVGEAVGRKSHESKDVYGDVLNQLDIKGQLYLSNKAKNALGESSAFRAAFQDWAINKGLTDDEMSGIWERNFGSAARIVQPTEKRENPVN